jgi:WD40 repeat protein/tRNA A-37 threonylcarbamoyl transferase component Bud32
MSGAAAEAYCPRCAGRLLLDASPSGTEEEQPVASAALLCLGDYELGEELGRGAMGVVYRARQPRLKREVAVKAILASRFVGEAARKRFLAEAELAAQLDHPNIVPMYEVGETADGPFYAMKLIEGGTLAERMAREKVGEWESDKTAALLAKIARAVHHAHQRGVLHRDLKPGNILIDAQDEPYITDFGLARQLGVESSLTVSGSSLGTPAYMAPEQASGERGISTAADVWSLGAILFHLLGGRPPFSGATAADVLLQARTNEAPSLRALNPSVARDLETICLKCLEKEPVRRYTSAAELADDLGHFLHHEPIRARPSTAVERVTKWARRRPAVAALTALAGVLLIVALAGTTWQWRRAEAHAGEVRQRLVRMAVANGVRDFEKGDLAIALPWFVEALRIEGTDRRSQRGGNHGSTTASGPAHRIRFSSALRQVPRLVQVWFHGDTVASAVFSPDGRRVLTASRDGVAHVWDAGNGCELLPPLRHPGRLVNAVFSPDGKLIGTGSADGTARLWSADTGKPLPLPFKHADKGWARVSFSPDGRRLVTQGEDVDAQFWDVASGLRLQRFDRSEGLMFSPDGRRMICWMGNDAELRDADSGSPVGVNLPHGGGIRFIAFSRDGGSIATAGQNGARVWRTADGVAITPRIQSGATIFHAEFSPDGHQLATASGEATARVWSAATGQAITPPLRHGESVQEISFSPDGRWVLTASDDHTARVWDAASGVPVFAPLWHGNAVRSAHFSPDGRRVLTASADGIVRLWDLAATAPDSIALPGESEVRRAWLDVARQSAITTDRDNQVQVWSLADGAARGPAVKLSAPCNAAALSPDGLWLAAGTDGGTMRVWEVATGNVVSKFSPGGSIRHLAWRPDGRQLVFCGSSQEVFLVDPATGLPLRPEPANHYRFTHAAFSADGRRVAAVGRGGVGQIWDTVTGQLITPSLAHGGVLRWVQFSDDGLLVATTSTDGTARLWNSTTGEPVLTPLRHGGWANEVAFSRDGRRLMSTSDDGTARLWDTITGRPATAPLRLHGGVWRPCISRDGRRVLACNQYFSQAWEGESGTPLTPVLNPHAGIRDIAFSHDEQHVLMITSDRRILSWDLAPTDAPLEDMAALARLLTGRVLDATGALVPLEQALEGIIPEHLSVLLASLLNGTNAAPDGPSRARAILRRDWERLTPVLNPKQRPAGH